MDVRDGSLELVSKTLSIRPHLFLERTLYNVESNCVVLTGGYCELSRVELQNWKNGVGYLLCHQGCRQQ